MSKRRAPLLVSLAFLLSSLALLNQVNLPVAPAQQPAQVATVEVAPAPAPVVEDQGAQAMIVEGVWEQYSLREDGQRELMCRIDIRRDGLDFVANPSDISPDVSPKHPYSSYDHRLADGQWTFKEDWDGQVGKFVLERQCNGEYQGIARLEGGGDEDSFATVFVRVGD